MTSIFYFYWKKVIGRLLELAVQYAALEASCGIFRRVVHVTRRAGAWSVQGGRRQHGSQHVTQFF
jgi:hypothetical protein